MRCWVSRHEILAIAPGGGEEVLIFSGFCKSLSTPLCFCFCARGCSRDLCTLAQRDGAVGRCRPRHRYWDSQYGQAGGQISLPGPGAVAKSLCCS